MKQLRIVYADIVLFDGAVDELVWTDSAGEVSVSGRMKASGKGVADLLAGLAAGKKAEKSKREESQ